MKYLITFSYDGSKYNGYQKQLKKNTVQEEIEKALKRLNKKKVSIYAAGRTDKKVHAYGQRAHFNLDINITPERLKKALNSIIPDDIYIIKCEEVDDDFHARYNVKNKEYIYKINIGEYNPIEKDYVYQYCKDLDIEKMNEAIKYFIGEHNFKSFTSAKDVRDNYVRNILDAGIIIKNNIIIIKFIGTGFLRYMVRNMVGVLIEIGEGKRLPIDVVKILEEKDRKKAGITAHPEGLYLKKVNY